MAELHQRIICEFIGTDYRFWNGEGQLTLSGKTYEGASFVGVTAAEAVAGAPPKRLTANFFVADSELRSALSEDFGPLPVQINWIYSADGGSNWTTIGRKHFGRLSGGRMDGGVYSCEIETGSGGIDRGRPYMFSHEDQMARWPGDKGFEYLRALVQGKLTNWPP